MPTRVITIHNVCTTTPQQERLGGTTGFREVQWKGVKASDAYAVHLPGGLFTGKGHDVDFTLIIIGNKPQPDTPLELVPKIGKPAILSDYISDPIGQFCKVDSPPPEIVIEADKRIPAAPKKKAAAPK